MKTPLGLAGLFLLVSVMQACAGDQPAIQVYCTYWWFFAKIKPTIFHDVYMDPDEAFLGEDCPVTFLIPTATGIFYEFSYNADECGITSIFLQEILVLQTKIKYISFDLNDSAEMPLSCVLRSQHPLSLAFKRREKEHSSKMKSGLTRKRRIASRYTRVASTAQPRDNLSDTCVANDVPLVVLKPDICSLAVQTFM